MRLVLPRWYVGVPRKRLEPIERVSGPEKFDGALILRNSLAQIMPQTPGGAADSVSRRFLVRIQEGSPMITTT
jgi:hypothetical protein